MPRPLETITASCWSLLVCSPLNVAGVLCCAVLCSAVVPLSLVSLLHAVTPIIRRRTSRAKQTRRQSVSPPAAAAAAASSSDSRPESPTRRTVGPSSRAPPLRLPNFLVQSPPPTPPKESCRAIIPINWRRCLTSSSRSLLQSLFSPPTFTSTPSTSRIARLFGGFSAAK